MRKVSVPVLLLAIIILTLAAAPADAQGNNRRFVTNLRGFEEVPAISTLGRGRFEATLSEDGTEMDYSLVYSNLTGNVLQAHIHFGQEGVNGGIMVFLCTNLGNGPAGTPPCPSPGTEVEGTIVAADVIAIASQGIPAGQLGPVLRAIRGGVAYVNVHTNVYPGGEIRGQLDFRGRP
ncbi:MAG TPA: CHRD domain-containing protein [Thermoanaerobaculia bacterium]|nr:CHRD domain-containing protein [Thermoanaerobaculia bacterium]